MKAFVRIFVYFEYFIEVHQIEEDEDTTIIRDHLDIFQTLLETFKRHGSMSMGEDYPAWKESGFSNSRAKLLLVDQADYNTQHIFFDDNADEGDECIVDVRDVITGEKIDQVFSTLSIKVEKI